MVLATVLAPSRRVEASWGNFNCYFPSNSEEVAHPCESKLETGRCFQAEFLEPEEPIYLTQVHGIPVTRRTSTGGQTRVNRRLDFMLLWPTRCVVSLEEWRYESKLQRDSEIYPGRYVKDSENRWHDPELEEATAALGFEFCIKTEANISPCLVENVAELRPYLEHRLPDCPDIDGQIIGAVCANREMLLSDLVRATRQEYVDRIFGLIASKQIYVDLEREFLHYQDKVHIYPNADMAKAFRLGSAGSAQCDHAARIDLKVGTQIMWDGVKHKIKNVGKEQIYLENSSAQLLAVCHAEFSRLVASNAICSTQQLPDDDPLSIQRLKVLLEASPTELGDAPARYELVRPNVEQKRPPSRNPRWIYDLYLSCRNAELRYGNAFLGAISRKSRRGNSKARYEDDELKIFREIAKKRVDNCVDESPQRIRDLIQGDIHAAGFLTVGKRTVRKIYESIDLPTREGNRKGRRARNAARGPYNYSLSREEKRGAIPWQHLHADSTQCRVECKELDYDHPLGRPWVTKLHDGATGFVLTRVLSYFRPRGETILLLMRRCIEKYNMFGLELFFDGGSEHDNQVVQQAVAYLRALYWKIPAHDPKKHAQIERSFRSDKEEFFAALQGATDKMRQRRSVTAEAYPEARAIWTLDALDTWIGEFDDLYNDTSHGNQPSPNEQFELGLRKFGERKFLRCCPGPAEMFITMPPVSGWTREVQPGGYLVVDYVRYGSAALDRPELYGRCLEARKDFDASVIYAKKDNQLVRCISEYHALLSGRSRREVAILSDILRRRNQYCGQRKRAELYKWFNFLNDLKLTEQELSDLHRARADYRLKMRQHQNVVHDEKPVDWSAMDVRPDEHKTLDAWKKLDK